ncbi:MAG: cupin domain-containing protein [Dehalococcoidales bacterium]
MFYDFPKDFKELEPFPGALLRVISGQRVMLSHVTLRPNSEVPLHSHPEEQMGVVLEGEVEFTIGNETKLLKKGNAFLAPSNTTHGGVAGADGAVVQDVFSPPREAYK